MSDNSLLDESTEGIDLQLSFVIDDAKIGIPSIKEGGKIMLYIPSKEGCNGSGHSHTAQFKSIFEVELPEII